MQSILPENLQCTETLHKLEPKPIKQLPHYHISASFLSRGDAGVEDRPRSTREGRVRAVAVIVRAGALRAPRRAYDVRRRIHVAIRALAADAVHLLAMVPSSLDHGTLKSGQCRSYFGRRGGQLKISQNRFL